MAFQAYSRDNDCGMCRVPSAALISQSPLSQSPLSNIQHPTSHIAHPTSYLTNTTIPLFSLTAPEVLLYFT